MSAEQIGCGLLFVAVLIGLCAFLWKLADKEAARVKAEPVNAILEYARTKYPGLPLLEALALYQEEVYNTIYTKAEIGQPIKDLIDLYFSIQGEKMHEAELQAEASSYAACYSSQEFQTALNGERVPL